MRLAGRWLLFVVLLGVSILLSVLGTIYLKSPFLSLLLVFPFLPFVFGRRRTPSSSASMKRCPACGFETEDALASFCPRDASRLQVRP